jgi:hypothetical protein
MLFSAAVDPFGSGLSELFAAFALGASSEPAVSDSEAVLSACAAGAAAAPNSDESDAQGATTDQAALAPGPQI